MDIYGDIYMYGDIYIYGYQYGHIYIYHDQYSIWPKLLQKYYKLQIIKL